MSEPLPRAVTLEEVQEGGQAAPAASGRRRLPALLHTYRWWLATGGWTVLAGVLFAVLGSNLNPYLTLTGLIIGFLIGLTGMGGGALMTPVLIFFFGFKPTFAIGTDVTYSAITKVFGAWRHWRQGSVDVPLTLYLAMGSVPATVFGVSIIHFLKNAYGDRLDTVLYRLIGSALVVVGVTLVVRSVIRAEAVRRRENITLSLRSKLLTVTLGAATGFVVGLTSVGSGTFLGLFLLVVYPLATSRVVGTDVFHAAILLGAASLAQASIGNVKPWMVLALLLGSIPGIVIGSHLTLRTPSRLLRIVLAIVLFLSGIALLGKA